MGEVIVIHLERRQHKPEDVLLILYYLIGTYMHGLTWICQERIQLLVRYQLSIKINGVDHVIEL
jgi:hypothetical protein